MNEISSLPFVIGVAGGSGVGKSTVTQQVLASFGTEMVSVVMQDDYYRDQSDLTPETRRKQNYDHPQAFDWPLLVEHVRALRNGEAIEMPEYDFTISNRSSKTIPVKPAPVIVIEGLFALYDADLRSMMSLKIFVDTAADLRSMMSLKIFVDTAADVRFIRRLQRISPNAAARRTASSTSTWKRCVRCTSSSSSRPSATPTSSCPTARMARRSTSSPPRWRASSGS